MQNQKKENCISDNIRKLMRDNGLSLIAFADEIGFTQPSISRWLTGNKQPSIEGIIAICNRFDVSADWLIFGKEW